MKNFKKPKKNKGFTLVELLIYISLSAILLWGVVSFVLLVVDTKNKNQTVLEVEQQGIFISRILISTIQSSVSINSPARGASSTVLSLEIPDVNYDPTIFSVSDGVLSITEGTSTAVALNNDRVAIENLVFYNYSRTNTPGIITFDFTLVHQSDSEENKFNYEKIFHGSASLF